MKTIKRIGALMLIMTLIMSAFTFASASSGTVTTSGKCNLRRGPGLDYSSITTIPADTKMSYDKTSKDERGVTWFRVSYNGKSGWVSGKNIHGAKSSNSGKGSIKLSGSEHLRTSPSRNATSITTIPSGTKLSYYKTSTDSRGVKWYMVTYKGETGWVSSMYSEKSSSKKSSGYRFITAHTSVPVRSKPSLSGSKLATMSNWDIAEYLGSTKYDDRGVKWYKVKYEGVTGWVSSKYTTKDVV